MNIFEYILFLGGATLDKVSLPVKYFPYFPFFLSFFLFLYRIKVAEEIIQRKGISGFF